MTYGCYNRKPFHKEQKIFGVNAKTGVIVCIVIPHVMTKDCQYQKIDKYSDKGCIGCMHKEVKEVKDGN